MRPFKFTVVFYASAIKSYVLTVKSTPKCVGSLHMYGNWVPYPVADTAPSLSKIRVFEPLNEPEPLT